VGKKKDFSGIPAIDEIDKTIHEPARLILLSYLYVLDSADYLYLKNLTELTWGNLSSHLTKLEEAGYVEVKKEFVKKKPHSMVSITEKGKTALEQYRIRMKKLLKRPFDK